MLKYITHREKDTGLKWIETDLLGKAILNAPLLNKGTAFTPQERETLKLLGKLPYQVETLEEQLTRAKKQYKRYASTLQKFIYLDTLHDTNEILFYTLLMDDIGETLPKVYTPGVGYAVKESSREFRQPRGLYIAYPDIDKVDSILENRTHAQIELLVATDGERILGIGDQGIGGMDIPIAKLVVYSLCGVNPYKTLPIMLDVGTDNQELLNDPLYLGWRHPRIRGKEYDDFIEKFVKAIAKKFPTSLIQWEDFGINNARRVLETYRKRHSTFNDDMQGTGVITLAALLAAIKITGVPFEKHRIVVFGAGTAGIGIADQLFGALLRQGISEEDARRQFWLIDKDGLLMEGMPNIASFQQPFVRPSSEQFVWANESRDLLSVVNTISPTILIGCSTVRNAFTEEVVEKMAATVERPIIFPLSNPNENCEANPENLIRWTKGKALIAAGSPFEPVEFNQKTYRITQCNNAFSFPGIGLGVLAVKAKEITDNMLWAAANAIAQHSPAFEETAEALLPPITKIREMASFVGLAVAKQAVIDKVATKKANLDSHQAFVQENIWEPKYLAIKPTSRG